MKEFEDPINTAVFTTRFVVNDNKLITYVSHDVEDGAWQFFSDDEIENYEDVALIVGLGEIIELDKTVLEIAHLQMGFIATRQSASDNWLISKQDTEK